MAEVIRKSREFGLDDLLGAVELMNEPDYEWLPDEYRIERSQSPASNPLTKYVTELHLSQIPDRDFSTATELKPWGGYGIQEGEWGVDPRPAVPLLEFPWGAKFDWYISKAAAFHEHMSWAVRDEVNTMEQPVPVVSSAVTHNNLLYFAQLYRSNKNVFKYVDAVGVHPYHFPGHNIWDKNFRNAQCWPEWKSQTPRSYAELCFKRFDFIEEIARCTRMEDQDLSFGLAGKRIWVTEFGIPTKSSGRVQRPAQSLAAVHSQAAGSVAGGPPIRSLGRFVRYVSGAGNTGVPAATRSRSVFLLCSARNLRGGLRQA